ncbi:MAG: GAF domain-containing protein [Deltaproteobacteria bacterium]|nr:MAG: GAF domain-containing protein [Deltaproteobacteria bacterium]
MKEMHDRAPALDVAYRELLVAMQHARSLYEVADVVVRHARRVLEADGASVTDVRDDVYVYRAVAGSPVPVIGDPHPLAGSFTGEAVAAGEPRLFRLAEADGGSYARALADGIKSGLVAPIIVGGKVIGTVGATSGEEDAFDASDLRILSGFAAFLAIGLGLIEKARAAAPKPEAAVAPPRDQGAPLSLGMARMSLDTIEGAALALAGSELDPHQHSLAELLLRTTLVLRTMLGVDPN